MLTAIDLFAGLGEWSTGGSDAWGTYPIFGPDGRC